jgi:hypothetical protein
VGAVERGAGLAGPAQQTVGAVLLGLLVRVVAALAEGLQVAVVEEDRLVATVRLDMVDHRRQHHLAELAMHAAQRLLLQLRTPQPQPASPAIEVMVAASHVVEGGAPAPAASSTRGGRAELVTTSLAAGV